MEFWFEQILTQTNISIDKSNFHTSFQDGNAFAHILSRYRPGLLNMKDLELLTPLKRLKTVFEIADENFGISPLSTPSKFLFNPDKFETIHYLIQWHTFFKNETINDSSLHTKNLSTFKRKHGGRTNAFSKGRSERTSCRKCSHYIYTAEKIFIEGFSFHRECFTCELTHCETQLTRISCSVYHDEDGKTMLLCPYHFNAIVSADFTVGFSTLKHAHEFTHFTTEKLATKAYEGNTSENLNESKFFSDSSSKIVFSQTLPYACNIPTKFCTLLHIAMNKNKTINFQNSCCVENPCTLYPSQCGGVSDDMVHVDKSLDVKALVLLFNPQITSQEVNVDSKFSPNYGQELLYRTYNISSESFEQMSTETDITESPTFSNSGDSSEEEMQEENQRTHDALRRAWEIDEKIDLVRQRMENLEETGKSFEDKVRNKGDDIEEKFFLEWSGIMNEKIMLERKENYFSFKYAEFQLNDECCRVEKELSKKVGCTMDVERNALLNEKSSILAEIDELAKKVEEMEKFESILTPTTEYQSD